MKPPTTFPKQINLSCPPEEVAAALRVRSGFVWLDTAGNPHDADSSISILAAEPREILRGHLSHPADLREALHRHFPRDTQIDLGFPTGGLIGTVDYDGAFHFGVYDRTLIYHHANGQWWETGNMSALLEPPAAALEIAQLSFRPLVKHEEFCRQIRRSQDYIRAGDIYQVNLSHPFTADWPPEAAPFALYARLRHVSPAPCAAFLDQDSRCVLSSSPESFLKMSGRIIRTRPIKGTRPRFRDLAADQKSSLDLLTSEKERAELLMITDLERNDLGQVCEFGSVTVPELLKLERYSQVFHLVSTVQGTLRANADHVSALAACFPGGSITGAPKKRAREIIAELETHPRGLYTGAIGILGANGESHFSIAIRTLVTTPSAASFHVGAGIVADSQPEMEYQETLHKAAGILSAAGSG